MNQRAASFQACRPKLYGIAYRMLGSRADAEDILQDAYLRWHGLDEAEFAGIRSAEAWLVTAATRLCLDRLRHAKLERETYQGPWLPEPLVAPAALTPEESAELASDVSMAFMVVLERLAPEERAAFLLHQVFDLGYDEIAGMVGKSQAACRQLVHRARERVAQERRRFAISRETHVALLQRFMDAARSGDRAQLTALLADNASMTADGGGKAVSVNTVMHGADRIARLFHVVARQLGERASYRIASVNGEPGLLRLVDGKLDSVISLVTDGSRIVEMYSVRNPDKLRGIAPDV